MRKDHLHLRCRKVDSYNMPFNAIISEREPGKSTVAWTKVYNLFRYKHRASLVIRRQIVDITETYIEDIEKVINKFQSKKYKIKLEYKKGDLKEGIVNVYLNGKLFIRVIALSNPMSRIKSNMIRNPGCIIFDEFICNNRMGEKYLQNESFKFKEIYNTYQRECKGYILKCYFFGNPYSLYNPYFTWWKVDTLLLKSGAFIVGKNYVISCYRMKPELRESILKRNPLYQFDDSYKDYAFNGKAINDNNIRLEPKKPQGYYLKYIFNINNKHLSIYKGSGKDYKYWITVSKDGNKKAISFDFSNLSENSTLINKYNVQTLITLKYAISERKVSYQSIEASYLIEDIYKNI